MKPKEKTYHFAPMESPPIYLRRDGDSTTKWATLVRVTAHLIVLTREGEPGVQYRYSRNGGSGYHEDDWYLDRIALSNIEDAVHRREHPDRDPTDTSLEDMRISDWSAQIERLKKEIDWLRHERALKKAGLRIGGAAIIRWVNCWHVVSCAGVQLNQEGQVAHDILRFTDHTPPKPWKHGYGLEPGAFEVLERGYLNDLLQVFEEKYRKA